MRWVSNEVMPPLPPPPQRFGASAVVGRPLQPAAAQDLAQADRGRSGARSPLAGALVLGLSQRG